MAIRILLNLLFIGVLAAWASPAACADGSGLYDEEIHARAIRDMNSGNLASALDGFCAMLERPQRGDLWTIAVHLICEEENLAKAVSHIPGPAPVFAMKKEFEGRCCYRVCAGLTTSRNEAMAWQIKLPEELLHAGPFPVKIEFCEPSAGWDPLQALSPVSDPRDEAPEGEDYPEVELVPVERKEMETPLPPDGPEPAGEAGVEIPGTSLSYGAPLFASPKITSLPNLPGSLDPRFQDSSEAESWFQKGISAYAAGDRATAKKCYEESLKHNPGKPEALNNLGILYLEEERYERARALFESAILVAPGYSRAHLNLSGALWGLNKRDEAVRSAQEAVRLDNHDVNAHLTLASFLRAEGREDEALAEARMVLILEPNNLQAKEFIESPPDKGLFKKMKGWFRRDD